MQRFYRLRDVDKVRAYKSIRDHLGDRVGEDTRHDEKVRRRAEALDALAQVRDHLGLAADQAPTKAAFDREARALGLPWTGARVIKAWDRWRFATDALKGGQAPLTAAQKSLQRAVSGKERAFEEPLTALRRWLETAPRSTTTDDYDEWSRETNDGLDDDELPVPGAAALRLQLSATWPDLVRVGKGEIGLAQARPIRPGSRRRGAGPYDLVARGEILPSSTCRNGRRARPYTRTTSRARWPSWVRLGSGGQPPALLASCSRPSPVPASPRWPS